MFLCKLRPLVRSLSPYSSSDLVDFEWRDTCSTFIIALLPTDFRTILQQDFSLWVHNYNLSVLRSTIQFKMTSRFSLQLCWRTGLRRCTTRHSIRPQDMAHKINAVVLSRSFSSGSRVVAKKDQGSMFVVKAGLPMFLFCGIGVWVVASGLEGKNKERDTFQGRISK